MKNKTKRIAKPRSASEKLLALIGKTPKMYIVKKEGIGTTYVYNGHNKLVKKFQKKAFELIKSLVKEISNEEGTIRYALA